MELNRAQRAAARHKKTEAVDSFVDNQKDEPVHSYSEGDKTLWRSGVVVRNDKNVGHDAMQRARELLDSVEGPTFARPKTAIGANDTWFKNNQKSVEQQIGERLELNKRIYSTQVRVFVPNDSEQPPIFDYQPQIDDDAEEYIPMSER